MGGVVDYVRMVLGWWNSPPVTKQMCFDLIIETPEFTLRRDADVFEVLDDSPTFDLHGRDC